MLFPSAFPALLTSDAALNAALTASVAETRTSFPALRGPTRVAISVASIDESTSGPPNFRHAGVREREMHFSASLLKVAAMYAAFELRQSVNSFALTAGDCDPTVLFPGMATSFDSTIKSSAALIPSAQAVAPKYRSIFDSTGLASGGCLISFTPAFTNLVKEMIVNSSNASAGACIQHLGYSWINGLLAQTGLFDPGSKKGIWLAGTFIGALTPVRVPSQNDGPSAQAMTCFDMANLYALLVQRDIVDGRGPDSICDEMLQLLAGAAVGADPSWLTPGGGVSGLDSDYRVNHTKIGLGPLNTGGDIASEATLVLHKPTGKTFIVVFQNVSNDIPELDGMAFLVDRTIKRFLGIP